MYRIYRSRNRGAYKGHWEPGSIYQERDVDEVQGWLAAHASGKFVFKGAVSRL